MTGETSLLSNDWASGGKITGASVTEPTRVETHILIFRDGELALRPPNVIAVLPVFDAHLVRTEKAPAMGEKTSTGLLILDVGCQFEGLVRLLGRADEAEKLA